MKKILLFSLSFVLAFIFMGLINAIPTKNVEFKLIRTFGAEEKPKEAFLTNIIDVTTDNSGNLYVCQSSAIISFKPDGTFRWAINKEGRGPGDIYNPLGMAVDGDKYLYLANINGTRIDRFNLEGKYINTLKVNNGRAAVFFIKGFIKPDLLIVSDFVPGKIAENINILKIENEIKTRNHFIVDETGDVKLSPSQGVVLGVRVIGDKIAVGNCYKYNLRIYDSNGKLYKTFKKDFNRLPKPYVYSTVRFSVFGGVNAPYRINNNYYLITATWPVNTDNLNKPTVDPRKNEYEHSLDIFDENAKLIYTEKFDKNHKSEIGRILYSDNNGYLFTYKSLPYPQICKYQVIISDKK